MESIGCVRCEKFRCKFMAQTCALIAPVQPVLHRVSRSNETLTNAPKHYETHQYMSLGFNGRCEKFRCDFMARTCALSLLVQPALHRVSCCNETIQNAPKHYKMHKHMSLGCKTGWTDAINAKLHARNSHQFSPFCTEFHAVTKKSKMHPNTTKRTNTWF